MKDFVIIGNKAVNGGKISLNDLPGSAGRMDVLCRCVTSALFISFGMRRDINVWLILKGEPGPDKIVRFNGETMRSLNPDERSSGSLIQKALLIDASEIEKQSTPGVFVRYGNLAQLLNEFSEEKRPLFYLKEDGDDVTEMIQTESAALLENGVYILGDNQGVFEDDEKMIENADALKISVGPISLLSSQCITLILNVLDRATNK
ncbi:tRNA (pseudouridine(54)-N(1))-methyltransferase TrmY [Methanimicrococcus blatticola]|uniref:tRNA (pseudouridine(54)-N(1))-methyltransferase n=1 Tax=Methanimicrococcus blatticola TaxID=91560 RepID=A0A484F520_9EURY|nr:tRNA (pseudouridine(54)-N(1))-methyltransferase TrmY [Methanimicrococcus blatticola]MBZ3935561.1 tRNA (pseudouridine(54)-N(1))-methyltransferase TrmY [Methanimicrococcus blatticola]MCC2509204.1 tRNA (pseudouridine(54)-N(1))-methyltransferase TrmY [Methanimicrococcus blatticola]TDQ69430.1 tRNA (pseudouridine54-N1)-methyltransferase [Methanimicrococcus blatticola]